MDYTKGEWKIEGYSRREFTISADDTIIADVLINDDQVEAGANAHLIASAPDLYEALKGISEWTDAFDGSHESLETMRNNIKSMVSKALAKAEGKGD